jgi:hypothetical protein
MKKICEDQTLGKSHLDNLLEKVLMYFTVSFSQNLKVPEGDDLSEEYRV